MVFLNHAGWLISDTKYFDFGARGVEIFFILSGYMMAYNYSDRIMPANWKYSFQYMISKAKKFYFLHFITLMLMVAYLGRNFILHREYPGGLGQFGTDLILNVTLLKSWYWPSAFSFNGVTWFLSSILFAYLLIPKLVNLSRQKLKKGGVGLLFTVILVAKIVVDTCVYKMNMNPFPQTISFYTLPAYRFLDFLIGYLAYLLLGNHEGNKWKTWNISTYQCLVFLGYIISCRVFDSIWVPGEFLILTIVLIHSFTLNGGIFDKVFGNRVLVYLGNISFELYIIHNVIINILGSRIHDKLHLTGAVTMFLLFMITLGLGALCHIPKVKMFMTKNIWEKLRI